MRIKVDASEIAINAMDDQNEWEPMTDRKTGEQRLTEGRPTYRMAAAVRFRQLDGTWSRSVQTNVKLFRAPSGPVEAFQTVQPADGVVWVTPYVNAADRSALSILISGLADE